METMCSKCHENADRTDAHDWAPLHYVCQECRQNLNCVDDLREQMTNMTIRAAGEMLVATERLNIRCVVFRYVRELLAAGDVAGAQTAARCVWRLAHKEQEDKT